MGRKNRNVRQRNLPRAAQRQYTTRTQYGVRHTRPSTKQPSDLERREAEIALHYGVDGPPWLLPELDL